MISYDKSKYEKLKIKFKDSEKIEKNFSQSYQDIFILTVLEGKQKGNFVEIGAHDAIFINNTFLLEKMYQWSGVSIDIDPFSKQSYQANRKAKFYLEDALKINYEELFQKNNLPKQIDYLQIDIDPLINSFNCLQKIPFDKYRFSTITFETDYYDTNTDQKIKEMVRIESRKILKNNGYELIVSDVESNPNFPFEDWYVDSTIIDVDKYKNIFNQKESGLPSKIFLNENE